MKKQYYPPCVLKKVKLCTEQDILTVSVADKVSSVETAGQENAGFYDTTVEGSTFNHQWGDGL